MSLQKAVWYANNVGVDNATLQLTSSVHGHVILVVKGQGVPTTVSGFTLFDSNVPGDGFTYSIWIGYIEWFRTGTFKKLVTISLAGNWSAYSTIITQLNKDKPILQAAWGQGTTAPVITTPGLPKRTSQLFIGSVSGATPPTVSGGSASGTRSYTSANNGSITAYMPGATNAISKWELAIETGQSITWSQSLGCAITLELALRNDSAFEGVSGTTLGRADARYVTDSLANTPFEGDLALGYLDQQSSGVAIDSTHALFVTGVIENSNYTGNIPHTKQFNVTAQVINTSTGKPVQQDTAKKLISTANMLADDLYQFTELLYSYSFEIGNVVKAPDGTILLPYKEIYNETTATIRSSFTDLTDWHNYLLTLTEPYCKIGVVPLTWNGTTLTIGNPVVLHTYAYTTHNTKGIFLEKSAPSIAVTHSGAVIMCSMEPFGGVDGWYTFTSGYPDYTKPYAFNQSYTKTLLLDKLTVSSGSVSIASSQTTTDTSDLYMISFYRAYQFASPIGPSSAIFVVACDNSRNASVTDRYIIVSDTLTTTGMVSTGKTLGTPSGTAVYDLLEIPGTSTVIYKNSKSNITISSGGAIAGVFDFNKNLSMAGLGGMNHVHQLTSDGLLLLGTFGWAAGFELHNFQTGQSHQLPQKVDFPFCLDDTTTPDPLAMVLLSDRYVVVLATEGDNQALSTIYTFIIDLRAPKSNASSPTTTQNAAQPSVNQSNMQHVNYPNQYIVGPFYNTGLSDVYKMTSAALDTSHVGFSMMYETETGRGTPSSQRQYGLQTSVMTVASDGTLGTPSYFSSSTLYTFDPSYLLDDNSFSLNLMVGKCVDLGSGLFALPLMWHNYYGPLIGGSTRASRYSLDVLLFEWNGTSITYYPPQTVNSFNNTAGTPTLTKQFDYSAAPTLTMMDDGTILFGSINPKSYEADPTTGFTYNYAAPYKVFKLSVNRTNHTVSVVGTVDAPVSEWVIGWTSNSMSIGTTAFFSYSNKMFGVDSSLNITVPERVIEGMGHTQYSHYLDGFIKVPNQNYALAVRGYYDSAASLVVTPVYENGTCGRPHMYTGTGNSWYYPAMPNTTTTDGMLPLPVSAFQYSANDGFNGGWSFDGWPYHQLLAFDSKGQLPATFPRTITGDFVSNKKSQNTPDDESYVLMRDRFLVVMQTPTTNNGFQNTVSGDVYVIDIRGS